MLPHRQPCLNYRLLFLPQRHRSIFEAVCCALECFLPSFFFFFLRVPTPSTESLAFLLQLCFSGFFTALGGLPECSITITTQE